MVHTIVFHTTSSVLTSDFIWCMQTTLLALKRQLHSICCQPSSLLLQFSRHIQNHCTKIQGNVSLVQNSYTSSLVLSLKILLQHTFMKSIHMNAHFCCNQASIHTTGCRATDGVKNCWAIWQTGNTGLYHQEHLPIAFVDSVRDRVKLDLGNSSCDMGMKVWYTIVQEWK